MSMFQIVVLATFGALAIAGVVIFAFVVGSSQGDVIGEVEIWGTLDEGAFVVVLRQLAENDTRLRAVTYIQKNRETFARDLTDALASGRGPELFIMRQDEAERDSSKIIPILSYETYSPEQFKSTFIEAANPFLGTEGVRALPFVVDPLILYWNKDILATSGIARPPVYWEEMYAVASAIAKRDEANTLQRSALAFGEFANVDHAKDILSLLVLQAGGEVASRDATGRILPGLTSREAASAPAESALRFYTEFANPVKAYYTWNRAQKDSRAAFAAGTLGLYVGLASEEPLIRNLNPNLNFAAAPVPQIKNRPNSVNIGTAYGFALPRTGENPQGAQAVAYVLAGKEASKSLSQALGMPSARRDVLAEPVSGNDDLFNKQAIVARAWDDPEPDRTDIVFRVMIESVTSGAAQIQEAIQRADSSINEIVRSQQGI